MQNCTVRGHAKIGAVSCLFDCEIKENAEVFTTNLERPIRDTIISGNVRVIGDVEMNLERITITTNVYTGYYGVYNQEFLSDNVVKNEDFFEVTEFEETNSFD